ncbi:hypothetical protein [Microcoleus sp. Pol10D4]|uniref:hypothetical protein n=1 Tax=Microcoleus sp. Pol10D4 TaxID=3055387 RepID=UPI002FD196D4
MLNHSQEQAFGPVPQILNVLVEQAGKPVADIGARCEFVVTRRLKETVGELKKGETKHPIIMEKKLQ